MTEYQGKCWNGKCGRKKHKVFVISVMSLHVGAKISIRVNSELSEENEVKVGMHQGSALSQVVVGVVTELARQGAVNK